MVKKVYAYIYIIYIYNICIYDFSVQQKFSEHCKSTIILKNDKALLVPYAIILYVGPKINQPRGHYAK